MRKVHKNNESWNWVQEQKTDFNQIKQVLPDGQRLLLYANAKDTMVATDAKETEIASFLWQNQENGNIKPIAYGFRYLNYSSDLLIR